MANLCQQLPEALVVVRCVGLGFICVKSMDNEWLSLVITVQPSDLRPVRWFKNNNPTHVCAFLDDDSYLIVSLF